MNGIALANCELMSLLPGDLSEFNQYYWLVSSQAGWKPLQEQPTETDWDELESKLEASLVDVEALKDSDLALIDIKRFSEIIPHLRLDEWTYLIGFQASAEYLSCILEDHALFTPLLPAFFQSLTKHKATAIFYIDQWWECFPNESKILSGVGKGLEQAPTSSEKWIQFSTDYRTPVYPNLED